jgi:hypothetical protein
MDSERFNEMYEAFGVVLRPMEAFTEALSDTPTKGKRFAEP